MTVEKLPLGALPTNCYIVKNGDDAVIIDPADNHVRTAQLFNECKSVRVFLTHGHFDHTQGVAKLSKLGAKVYIHKEDTDLLASSRLSMADYFGFSHIPSTADYTFCDGERFPFGNTEIEVIHTPGHTKGSCCFIIGDALFSGDTVFRGSVGRTDTYGGDGAALFESLKKIKSLRQNYKIYPGHGPVSSLDYEKQHNVFMMQENYGL